MRMFRAARPGSETPRVCAKWVLVVLGLMLWGGGIAEGSNRTAPDFTLPDLGGAEVSLQDFQGKFLLVNFWATWCGPCKVEMPSLEDLHRRFKSERFAVLGISNDIFGAKVVQPYVEAQGLTFPILLDPKLDVSNSFQVLSLPTTYLIDPEGNIIGELSGAENWTAPETIQYFENLLKNP